ncbi:MAG: DegQ family serine endoprotease [Gammaproteobacteria bacterium]|nr:DegQ family serine endoprotease [Gammaproteobacteria bacterium]
MTLSPVNAAAEEKAIESLRQTGKAFSSVAKKVSPSVVFIRMERRRQSPFHGSPFDEEFLRRFFGAPRDIPQERTEVGQGSGFIFSKDGYILTNNHVAGDADRMTVRLIDGREFEATLVGSDPPSDVAVIHIETDDDLPILELGDSDALEVGEWVLAIGNPFGLSHTLTVGVVSATGRSSIGVADYENFIQTDAAINPGNSGGPLVNLDGEVVGINTAIFSQTGGSMGIGFAIPINMARAIAEQLLEHGEVTRGLLGVAIQDLTPELAESFGVEGRKGALVAEVMPDSPAKRAGIQRGDIVLEMNGKAVANVAQLRNRIALTAPGTKARFRILRDGRERVVNVKIGKLDAQSVASSTGPASIGEIGITVSAMTEERAQSLGYEGTSGVVITSVEADGPAARAGLRRGMLIRQVNQRNVSTTEEFREAIRAGDPDLVLLLVQDTQGTRFVPVRLG